MSVIASWMKVMGFNGKQVTEAAAKIGINSTNPASLSYRGERDLSKSELLAMSAIRAGLAPWNPENDLEAVMVKAILDLARHSSASKLADDLDQDIPEQPQPRRANA